MADKDEEVTIENVEDYQREVQRGRAYQIWSYSDTGHDLTVEEQLFCRSYIVDRNSVAAMRRLGYAENMSVASLKYRADRMLANPEVQDCIAVLAKRMMDNLQIEADNVNRHMASIAFADLSSVIEFDHNGVRVLHSKYWTPDQRNSIKSVKMGKDGIQIEFHDKMRALEFLGKQLGQVDSDADMARAAAEGAANAAMNRILEITDKMRGSPPPASEQVIDQSDTKH